MGFLLFFIFFRVVAEGNVRFSEEKLHSLLNYFFIKTIYNIRCRLANYLYLCMIYVMKKEALEKEN